jgi:Na+/phosphate symporter
MHCTNDAEKIADHTENILALTKRMEENDIKLSSVGQKDINDLWSVLKDQARHVITALESTDKKEVSKAIKDDIEIDKLADRLEHNMLNV